jgi:DnaJ domain
MSEPVAIDPAHFFEFVGGSRLAVLLVSVHPLHRFNPALSQRLGGGHPDMAFGSVHLYDLILAGGPALRFLHQGLLSCGAPSSLGVLPGYCLFQGGEMLAWDSGLPAFADAEAIGRSALLGALWSGVTRDVAFVGQALRVAAEQAAGQRVAARFEHAVADGGAKREAPGPSSPPPIDDLYWAYQILGVLPTATDREIHEAWRKRRKQNHPDHAAQDPAEFARRSRFSADINRARDIIENHRSGGARRPHA